MKYIRRIQLRRERRKWRVRNRVRGTAERPRLHVYRSHRNISCQIIDDQQGRTLVSASTLEKGLRQQIPYGGNRQAAEMIGKLIAQRALEKGIQKVCFDRGPYRYHGRIAALADAARQAGLQF